MIKHFIVVFGCLIALSSNAQNAKEDIMKINQSYSKYSDLSMGITYNVYANYYDEIPIESSAGSFNQHGSERYNRLNEIESVQNKECSLVIDNDEKIIVIGNPVKFNPAKITMMNLDTAFSKYSSVRYINKSFSQKGYEIIFKPNVISEYDKAELYFNAKTFVVERMVFYYRDKVQLKKTNQDEAIEKPRLEIIFSTIKFESNTDYKFYSDARFVEKKNGKYYPVSAYKGYKVIDQKIGQ